MYLYLKMKLIAIYFKLRVNVFKCIIFLKLHNNMSITLSFNAAESHAQDPQILVT